MRTRLESVCGDAEGQQEMSLVTAVACSTKPAGQRNRDSNIFKRGRGSSVYVPSLGHIREASARPLQGHCKAMRSIQLIHQMSHVTHGLGNIKQSEGYTYTV